MQAILQWTSMQQGEMAWTQIPVHCIAILIVVDTVASHRKSLLQHCNLAAGNWLLVPQRTVLRPVLSSQMGHADNIWQPEPVACLVNPDAWRYAQESDILGTRISDQGRMVDVQLPTDILAENPLC